MTDLRGWPDELAEDINECVGYVNDYFVDKWGLDEYPARWRDRVSALLDVVDAAKALPRAYIDEATNEVYTLHEALDRLAALVEQTEGPLDPSSVEDSAQEDTP